MIVLLTDSVADRVSREVSPDDAMYFGNPDHYFSVGASALHVISGALDVVSLVEPKRILDFGAGAGRVTRWLRAAFPAALIEACDVREQDMAFCREHLGVDAWTASIDPDALPSDKRFDLIWAGSVLTHLPADRTERLLRQWLAWTETGGLVIASLHGRRAIELASTGVVDYIPTERWEQIVTDYRATGYGYCEYVGWPGYGVSLTSLAWTANLVASWPDARLTSLSECAWDDHHDVIAIQRVGPTASKRPT